MRRSSLRPGQLSLERGSTFRRKGREFVARICPDCGDEFTRRVDSIGLPRCARCSNAARRRRVTVICGYCGREFETKASEVARGRGKFCSRTCSYAEPRLSRETYERMADQMSVARRGEGNPAFKHGRHGNRVRRFPWGVATKGDATCRNCGHAARHLHHVVPRSRSRAGRTDLRNGIPLCIDCHHGWHNRNVVVTHHCMTDDEFAFVLGLVGSAWVERNYPDSDVAQLIALDRVRNDRWLTMPDGQYEPMRVRTQRLVGREWLPEPRVVSESSSPESEHP